MCEYVHLNDTKVYRGKKRKVFFLFLQATQFSLEVTVVPALPMCSTQLRTHTLRFDFFP